MNRRSFIGSLAAFFVVRKLPATPPQMAFLTAKFETFDPVMSAPLARSIWDSKSALEIMAEVNAALTAVWANSAYVAVPDVIYIPEEQALWLKR
jgi:hypothetical protein